MSPSESKDSAKSLNAQRLAEAELEFRRGAFTASDVAREYPYITDEQLVGLYSHSIGDETFYPIWQFGAEGVRPELDDIRSALGDYAPDAITADRVMRVVTHKELGRLSIVDALESADSAVQEAAHRKLQTLGNG